MPARNLVRKRVIRVLAVTGVVGLILGALISKVHRAAFTLGFLGVLFPFFWLGASWVNAYAGGWQDLARKFPLPKDLKLDESLRFESLFMGMSSYRNAVHLEVDERGIIIRAMLLFRFGAAPIFIPRDAIRIDDGKFFFLRMRKLSFPNFPDASILFRPKLGKKIEESLYTAPFKGSVN